MLLNELYGFLCFRERKCARDERAGINFTRAEERKRFHKGAAAGAHHGEFFHDDGPGFHQSSAVKRGFKHQRSPRFGHLLRQRESRWRTGRLDEQRESFFYLYQVACIAANTFRLDSCPARERKLFAVLAVHHDTRNLDVQNACNQLREFAVTEYGSHAEFLDINLLENFTRRSKRLDKDGLLVADGIGHRVKIFDWQGEVFRECAVVRDDAKDSAPSAMCLETAPAIRADRSNSIAAASDVDFPAYAPSEPFCFFARGNSSDVRDFADKLVAGCSAKRMIAAKNFDVGVADSRQTYTD